MNQSKKRLSSSLLPSLFFCSTYDTCHAQRLRLLLLASCLLCWIALLSARRCLLLLCAGMYHYYCNCTLPQVPTKHTDSPIVLQSLSLPFVVGALMLHPPNSRVVWRRSPNPLTSARAKEIPFLRRHPPTVTLDSLWGRQTCNDKDVIVAMCYVARCSGYASVSTPTQPLTWALDDLLEELAS